MIRDDEIAAFLAAHGFGEALSVPLAQDASFRRYLRIGALPLPLREGEKDHHIGIHALLMDAPQPEDVRPFLRIAEHLAGIGVSVPRIIAADAEKGLLLEEDFGDDLFSAILTPDNADTLFGAAVDALVAMQRAAPPDGLVCWDAGQMATFALGTFFDWWWPAAFGASAPAAAKTDVADALAAMLTPVAEGPRGFVHRDFFAGNLIWLPDRTGIRRVGVIDFQLASLGHPAYDMVSLLQDARRDLDPALEDRMLARYLEARPEYDAAAFRAAYDACAAQRHLRVACQWVRLARRDGRPQYLEYGPRTWALLDRALQRRAAAPLAAALDRWVPRTLRGNP
jgi:aminoglycoside/choline kinase family phosphotransferase